MEIQQVFVRYIFAPLLVFISAIGLSFFNKKNSLLSNKKLIIGVLLSGLALAMPGLLGFLSFSFMPWGYIISMIYSFGLGVLAVYVVSKVDSKLIEDRKFFLFFAALVVIGLAIYLYQLAFNWLSLFDLGLWAAMSVTIFILPLVFWWTFISLLSIPTEINKMWEYPVHPLDINLDHLDFDKLMVLELELYKNTKDPEPLKVKVKAPQGMDFGVWFHKFIDDYNTKFPSAPVVFRDTMNKSYKWTFFVKKSLLRRNHYIDPDLNIIQNSITEKMTIHAKRVSENVS